MNPFPDCLLVANRGEIARRIIATARRLSIRTIAVYHDVDRDLPFVREADVAIELTADQPVRAYLDADQILAHAVAHGAAVHPGYGFLAENAGFARAVDEAGLCWVGPSPEAMIAMADKVVARRTVAAAGVPVSGTGDVLVDEDHAVAEATQLGYPVMVKAAGGGGGIGMAIAEDEAALRSAFASTRSMAQRGFGSDRVFLERYLASARHIEVQVLGLADGTIVVVGERDCSTQRRHQKLIEEAPAPGLTADLRDRLYRAAIDAASSVGYRNAGTVEFLLDTSTNEFVFLEMNTRIQVEHPVTELVYGVDLVEQQLSIAATGTTTPDFAPRAAGHAFEFRVCAEDPVRLIPRPGPIETWIAPEGAGVRVDSGYAAGNAVTPHFDSLVAKLCVHAESRDAALARARAALDELQIAPLQTNIPFLARVADSALFRAGGVDTSIVAQLQESETRKPKRTKVSTHG